MCSMAAVPGGQQRMNSATRSAQRASSLCVKEVDELAAGSQITRLLQRAVEKHAFHRQAGERRRLAQRREVQRSTVRRVVVSRTVECQVAKSGRAADLLQQHIGSEKRHTLEFD